MSTTFSCTIDTTDPSAELALEIWLDDHCICDLAHVTESTKISHDFDDEEGSHELRFVMKNKTINHTKIDAAGNILSDACITISDVGFDDILLDHLFVEASTYTHDFNGTGNSITESFYGTMGCNGTVTLAFTSPVYLWLLEQL